VFIHFIFDMHMMCVRVGRRLSALRLKSDVWNGVLGVMLSRDWKESYARIFVSWAAGAKTGQ
jgi:hypothetical protein